MTAAASPAPPPGGVAVGISTRVFLAFIVLLAVFGTVLGYALFRLHHVQTDARLIHHCYVPLSLTLSEAHTDLATYDAVLAERDRMVLRRVVQAQKVLYPFAKRIDARFARADEFIRVGLDRARRAGDRDFLERGAETIALMRSQVEAFQVDSETFRTAVLADDWERAFAQQRSLRQTVDQMQSTLRELRRATRAEISDAVVRADASERDALAGIVVLCVAASLIALLIMWLVHRTLRPIRVLTEAARDLGRGEYTGRVAVTRRDEVGVLAEEFNRMADNIEARERALRERRDELERAYEHLVQLREREERTQAELIKKERLAAIGRMTSQVTHELRNPLSSLGLNVELLEEELRAMEIAPQAEAFELVRAVTTEIDRLTEITEEYLAYARLPVARPRATDLGALAEELLGFVREELALSGIEVHRAIAPGLPPVQADPNQLRRALLNLLRNAREAMQDGGALSIATRLDAEGCVVLEIGDNGPGIAADDLQRIFDPFFSTKSAGTGLGLSLTSQIIEEHGGRILAASTVGQGTVFRIVLPQASHDVPRPGFAPSVVVEGDEGAPQGGSALEDEAAVILER